MIPFDSKIFERMVSTPEMDAVWSEERTFASWLEVERAITEVQSKMGLIPSDAAKEICAHLEPASFDVSRLRDKARESGHLFVGFLRLFREVCGPAAEHFHVGPTTQDILDTGLVLQLRDAHERLDRSMGRLERDLCRRAREYRDTPMMGRTHEQHALPYTFGYVLAGWALEIRAHRERQVQSRQRWLFGSLSGGVGTHNAFVDLLGVDKARELEERVCGHLGLPAPLACLHTRIDRFSEIVGNLALLTATLGRIGLHLRTMARTEIGEIRLVYGEEACGSSTMPNKRNPESLEWTQGLAQVVAGHAAAVSAIRMADHRDSTRIPVLATALPQSFAMAHRSASIVGDAIRTLQAQPDRMLSNIELPESLGQAVCERVMIAMYRKTGLKHAAHSLLSELSRQSREAQRPIIGVLEAVPELRGQFSDREWDELFHLEEYTGTAALQVDRIVQRLESRANPDASHGPSVSSG